jgi:hypothetical protein
MGTPHGAPPPEPVAEPVVEPVAEPEVDEIEENDGDVPVARGAALIEEALNASLTPTRSFGL